MQEHVQSANQAKGNASLQLQAYIHSLVSLIFAIHRATCKAIKTAADLFIRIRDYKGVCNVRQCVFYFRDREKSQKTLVKAEQLTQAEFASNIQSMTVFLQKYFLIYIFTFILIYIFLIYIFYKIYFCKKAVFVQINISIKKTAFLRYRFFTQHIYIYIIIYDLLFTEV